MPAMIHGRLGAVAPTATTLTAVYTVPASRKATVTLNVCNRGSAPITVRVAHIDGAVGAVANEDYIEWSAPLPVGGVLERTGITMQPTHTLAVFASDGNASAVVHGIEQDV
jgi:hypothetical protein